MALLNLSQVIVADRDYEAVRVAANHALDAVRAEADAQVIMESDDVSPVTQKLPGGFPMEADGVVYGRIAVTPSKQDGLDDDTSSYVRTVANQTAGLFRAIDLYGQIAEAAVLEERTILARELHDGVAQDLAVLRLRLAENHDSDSLGQLAERALAEARYAISVLRGRSAAPADFIAAIERQAEELADRFERTVEVQAMSEPPSLSVAAQVALLRIIREAVTNACRHGDATRVQIRIEVDEGVMVVRVVDDGTGFGTRKARTNGQYGLIGMDERVQALGGTLRIDSSPGSGTTVQIQLPLSREEVHA